MLTWPQVIARTDRKRKDLAKYVRLIKLKTGRYPNGQAFVAAQSYSTHVLYRGRMVPTKNRPVYATVVRFVDAKLHVVCSCSCPDFMYRWEVALHNKNAAEIEYSNGALPVETNPRMKPASCKHIVSLFEKVKHKLPK